MEKDNDALKQARTLAISSVIGLGTIGFLAIAVVVVAVVEDEKEKQDYKNVVIENKNDRLLVEDFATKERRIVKYDAWPHRKDALRMEKGDTLNVRTHDKIYREKKVLGIHDGRFSFNEDSIYARQQRELFNCEMQKMNSAHVR